MRREYIYDVYMMQSASRRALYIGMTNNFRQRPASTWDPKDRSLTIWPETLQDRERVAVVEPDCPAQVIRIATSVDRAGTGSHSERRCPDTRCRTRTWLRPLSLTELT